MRRTRERLDDDVRLLGVAREEVRFLAAIADIVRDLIEDERRTQAMSRFNRDAPPSGTAYPLTCFHPTFLN